MAQWMLIALGGSPKSATTAVSEHPFTTRSIGGVSTTKTALQANVRLLARTQWEESTEVVEKRGAAKIPRNFLPEAASRGRRDTRSDRKRAPGRQGVACDFDRREFLHSLDPWATFGTSAPGARGRCQGSEPNH